MYTIEVYGQSHTMVVYGVPMSRNRPEAISCARSTRQHIGADVLQAGAGLRYCPCSFLIRCCSEPSDENVLEPRTQQEYKEV